MLNAALDNDLLIKGARYLLLSEFVAALNSTTDTCGMLAAGRFICEHALRHAGSEEARNALKAAIQQFSLMEPSPEEANLAAEIELLAQQRGWEMDVGESLLAAMTEIRKISLFATGDKRAVVALEKVATERETTALWQARVICLEQTLLRLFDILDPKTLQSKVCADRGADRALSICFGCANDRGDKNSWADGLNSYIKDLRTKAPNILVIS